MDTFTPPHPPSASTTRTRKARVVTSQFGDGYSQRVGIGLNPVRIEATVVWDVLSHTDADSIASDLIGWAGVEAFLYALPPDLTTRRWICQTWTRSEVGPLAASISAEFVEVFDL